MGEGVPTYTDVAFAVTLKLDKLIRETLNMAAEGTECIQIMDAMFKEEREGWKLYHNRNAVWYVEDRDAGAPVPVLHELLTDLASEEKTRYDLTYFRLEYESAVVDGFIAHDGEYEDPFRLGYTLRLEYEEPKKEEEPCPPKRKRAAKTRTKAKPAPKRRGRKRGAGRRRG